MRLKGLPKWQHIQDYWVEKEALPGIDLEDEIFPYR